MDRIPYEIAKNIVLLLDKSDRLQCLTLCKLWNRIVIGFIYTDVVLERLVQFRQFLHFITRQENFTLGAKVKSINLSMDLHSTVNISEKRPNFTEFELLARHCPNLTELKFKDGFYWMFLNEIDFCNFWKRLNKIPDSDGSPISRGVYIMLGNRISRYGVDTSYSTYGIEKGQLFTDLEACSELRTVRICSPSTSLGISDVVKIINENHLLDKLLLNIKVEEDINTTQSSNSQIALSPSRAQKLKSISCLIDSQNHPLIKYIKKNITRLDKICFRIVVPNLLDDQDMNLSLMEVTRAIVLDDILELFSYSSKKCRAGQTEDTIRTNKLCIDLGEISSNFLDNFFTSLVYMTSQLYDTYTTAVAIYVTYAQENDIKPITSSSTTDFSSPSDVLHTFNVRYPYVPETEYSTVFTKLKRSTQPIISYISEVTIKETIQDPYVSGSQFHNLDLVLQHFICAKTIKFAADKSLLRKDQWRSRSVQITCQDPKSGPQHTKLTHLSIEGGFASTEALSYIFRKCPKLSSLQIDREEYNKESMLIIEYICLSRNIHLKK